MADTHDADAELEESGQGKLVEIEQILPKHDGRAVWDLYIGLGGGFTIPLRFEQEDRDLYDRLTYGLQIPVTLWVPDGAGRERRIDLDGRIKSEKFAPRGKLFTRQLTVRVE